jgi:hypothetical protein
MPDPWNTKNRGKLIVEEAHRLAQQTHKPTVAA